MTRFNDATDDHVDTSIATSNDTAMRSPDVRDDAWLQKSEFHSVVFIRHHLRFRHHHSSSFVQIHSFIIIIIGRESPTSSFIPSSFASMSTSSSTPRATFVGKHSLRNFPRRIRVIADASSKSSGKPSKENGKSNANASSNANDETPGLAIEVDARERMVKTMEAITRDFSTVRTGRANANALDRVEVSYYGATTSLKAMANVTTPDASTIVIQPFDKGAIKDIERAINESDLGMTPSNDGNVIRLIVPTMTEARRKELGKLVAKLGEDGKVGLRNVRRDAMKSIEKLEKAIGEDGCVKLKKSIEDLTTAYVKKVDDLTAAKEKEISKV